MMSLGGLSGIGLRLLGLNVFRWMTTAFCLALFSRALGLAVVSPSGILAAEIANTLHFMASFRPHRRLRFDFAAVSAPDFG